MKKTAPALIALIGLLGALVNPAGATVVSSDVPRMPASDIDGVTPVGSLEAGDALFWSGYVEDSLGNFQGGGPDTCAFPTAVCTSYSFDVIEPADRLRVAISDPSVTESFSFDLYAPDGTRVTGGGGFTWDSEKFVKEPALGTWTVRVTADMVENSPFRMRAKLEAFEESKSPGKPARDLLPNLRLMPPFEFTFEAPASLLGPGMGLGGSAPVSCSPRETIDNQDLRCLRFSLGPQNVGDGLLELRYQPTASPSEPVPVTQVVYRDDGSTWERLGGDAQYHASHAHYHHAGFGAIEIYKVLDSKKGELELVGTSPKQGYCIAPYVIVDWADFTNEPIKRSTCETRGYDAIPSEGAVMYLSKGWSDIYAWAIDNNYVDFGRNGDGLYVVSSTTDPSDMILETDERDNTSYALVSIQGDSIEVIERGYGQSPWDNHKELADPGLLYMNADTKWLPFNDAI